MKLSTKGRYGLRAMIDIAVYSEKEPVPICKIAERQSLSERYLEQLMFFTQKEWTDSKAYAEPAADMCWRGMLLKYR